MGIGGNALDTVLIAYPCVQGSIDHLSTSLGGIRSSMDRGSWDKIASWDLNSFCHKFRPEVIRSTKISFNFIKD